MPPGIAGIGLQIGNSQMVDAEITHTSLHWLRLEYIIKVSLTCNLLRRYPGCRVNDPRYD
jgi:hypothetical protein